MVIEVTGNKYNVGCGRGYGVDIPNLTLKLNLIVDRDRSTWPTPVDKRTQEEKDAGVPGPSPKTEIEEGDVFVLDGTVFAVDHDRLVQVVSETGALAFQRIYDRFINRLYLIQLYNKSILKAFVSLIALTKFLSIGNDTVL